jgi:hypothetical protein
LFSLKGVEWFRFFMPYGFLCGVYNFVIVARTSSIPRDTLIRKRMVAWQEVCRA